MRWALGSSLRFGRLVIALAIGLVVFGIAQLRSAPVDVYPEFTPPSVEIQTEALGLSAAETEQLITVPLEQDLLNGVPWLDTIHSSSMPGLSAIDLTFQPGTNIYAARQMVQERMTQAHALPNVGSPPIMIQPLASASRVAMIGLSSREVSLVNLSVLARWKIRPRLMGVPGVANVAIYGQRDRQLQVRVDPRKLAARGVSLTQVIETTGNALWVSPLTFVEASTPGTGGFVESPNQRLPVQHISPISTPQQLSQVPVEGVRALRLGDVTDVVEDHQPLIGDAVGRGAPGLFLVIEKFPGANTLQVTRGVEGALAEMAPGLKGISIDTRVYRPASYIESALGNAGTVALIGLVLLVAAVLLLFASWRAAVIALIVVPVSLLLAALVLDLRGATFSTITLVGLAAAVGLVIDDVVADIDAVRRRAARRRGAQDPLNVTVLAAFASSRGPLVFATLAILLALVPFLVMGTLATAFSGQLVLTYGLAVLASMLVAFTLTPALAGVLLRGTAAGREGPLAGGVRRLFDRLLSVSKLRPRRAWAAAGVLAVAALAVVPQIGSRSLLPALQDRNLLVQVSTVAGTSLPETDRIVGAVGRELRALPGVQDVGAHVGRAISSDQLVNVNSAEMWITLADGADYDRTRAAIQSVLHEYPGLRTHLGTYPGDRIAQVASAQNDDLVVRVFGADLATLQHKANQVRAMLAGVPGVASPVVRPIPTQPTADIRVKLDAALRYGLRPGDVRRDATTLTSGLIVGNLYEQSKIFDVVVWGAQTTRSDLTELGDMLIDTPSGRQVPLKDVATVTVAPEPTAITHDGVERDVEVAAKVTGDPDSVVAAVRSRLAAMPMPYEYHAEVSGSATVRRADLTRTLAYGAAALVGLFLLLQAAAGSWRRAGLMLASLPLSVTGGVLIAPVVGGVWNAGSLAGLFAVFALAVRSSILLARRILDAGQGGVGRAAVLDAARDRAVPLLQSVLLTAAVLLPAAAFGDVAGLEVLQPLAV
ncbi:MAG TPA: efflux RND transporter permease subunit, partial [Streptosporangiaceae bacterium]|nr:efflux RND transporter permease subunit [Streptosporangiaceae bacterium]